MRKYSKDVAEFIGIMLGDGYISYPKQQRIKISFNSLEKEYIDYVKELIVRNFNTKVIIKHRKNENTSEIYIFKRKTIKKIIENLGLVPSPKWDRAKIPGWIFDYSLEKEVLRGYFDTDGCVVITNNNGSVYPRIEMKISPSPMQEQFVKMLKKLNFKFGCYDIGKGKVRIQINGKKETMKWAKIIGSNNHKHITKLEQFL